MSKVAMGSSGVRWPMKLSYAVVWREAGGPVYTGKLEIAPDAVRLRGSSRDGAVWAERLPYEQLASVRIGRSAEDRLGGERTLVLERSSGSRLHVASLDGLGIVHELADQVAELTAGRARRLSTLVVVVPLRAGTCGQARALLEHGPPFDPGEMPLERHRVFLTEHEAVFLFEGANAGALVNRLVGDPAVWKAAAAWRRCLAGRPRLAEDVYSWDTRKVSDR